MYQFIITQPTMSAANIDYSRTHIEWTVEFLFRFDGEMPDFIVSYTDQWRGDWRWGDWSNDGLVRYDAADMRNPPNNGHIRVLLGPPSSRLGSLSSNIIHRTVTFWIPSVAATPPTNTIREFARMINRRFPSIYATLIL